MHTYAVHSIHVGPARKVYTENRFSQILSHLVSCKCFMVTESFMQWNHLGQARLSYNSSHDTNSFFQIPRPFMKICSRKYFNGDAFSSADIRKALSVNVDINVHLEVVARLLDV